MLSERLLQVTLKRSEISLRVVSFVSISSRKRFLTKIRTEASAGCGSPREPRRKSITVVSTIKLGSRGTVTGITKQSSPRYFAMGPQNAGIPRLAKQRAAVRKQGSYLVDCGCTRYRQVHNRGLLGRLPPLLGKRGYSCVFCL